MKKRMRIPNIIVLAVALLFCTVLSGCYIPGDTPSPLWVAVKSVGGDNGLFAEGQDFNFTLCFGYSPSSIHDCQIAVITVTNTNNDTAEKETRTFVIDDFSDEKYYKRYNDASAPTMELSYPAPANQPCTGGVIIEIVCYEDEAAYQAGENFCGTGRCTVIYLAESGVGTIIGSFSVDELWKRRCNILLAEGKLTRDEYNSEMHKLQGGISTVGHKRGISSGWTESGLNGGGDVSFIETVDDSGVSGTFSSTTDSQTVTVSYLTQLDSGWYNVSCGTLYVKYKQVFSLTAETENGVETWFVLYNDGKLTPSRPVSGWCSGYVNEHYILVTDSQDGGAETYYKLTDDMSLPELETENQ